VKLLNNPVRTKKEAYVLFVSFFIVYYLLITVLPLCKTEDCDNLLEIHNEFIEGAVNQFESVNKLQHTSTSTSVGFSTIGSTGPTSTTTLPFELLGTNVN
jgi:hypothetical protein